MSNYSEVPNPISETLHPGGIYLTFSGDPATPYCFAKLLQLSGNSIWLKLYHGTYRDIPTYDTKLESTIMNIPLDTFLAWGPPRFPQFVIDEEVSDDELRQCVNTGTNVFDFRRVVP